MSTREDDLKHAIWTIRCIVADDAFAATHQSLGQYRSAILKGIANVMNEILLGDPSQHPALQSLQQENAALRARVEALKKLAEQVPWITGDWTESQKAMEPEFAKVLEESAFDLIGTPSLTRPAVPEDFLEIPDVEDESGINTHYSRDLVLECIAAALAAAPQPEATIKESSRVEAQPTEAAQPADNPSEDYKQGWMDGMSEATRLSAPVVMAKDALGLLAIEDDAIVLRLTADAAASSFANDPKAQTERPAVTDKQQFLRDVFNALASEREDGSTRLTDVLDWAEREAWEQGSLGLAAQKGGV